ncbi:MAG: HD domain-containing protein [Rhodospirillaceae bacterium]
MTEPNTSVDAIMTLYRRLGRALFFGQPISQTDHALQTAWLAEQAGATAPLIAASLLHDIGHLLMPEEEEQPASTSQDYRHADTAASYLSARFIVAVVEPVRLHVQAKRYLCAFDPAYPDLLTAASRVSLTPQGGLMTAAEATAFNANPYAADALALRRWDEMGRVAGLPTPPLAHFRPMLESSVRTSSAS